MRRQLNYIIVICAYNEEENLKRLLRSVDNTRAVLVDDGSTDSTSALARSMGFTVLEHSHRLGKTTALRDGLDFAKKNQIPITVVLDADALPEPDAIESTAKATRSSSCWWIDAASSSLAEGGCSSIQSTYLHVGGPVLE